MSVTQASDAVLADAITAAAESFDLYTDDRFEPETGLTLDMKGTGYPRLYLPKRIRSVTSVSLLGSDGVFTLQTATNYRVVASLPGGVRTELDEDYIEVVEGRYLSTNYGYWPWGTNTVRVVGDFSWLAPPKDVKRAVATIVYNSVVTTGDRVRQAQAWQTADASYQASASSPTGLHEVDKIISRFARNRVPAV